MRPVSIVFAKSPVPGGVKTRLLPRLSPEQAAAFHHACVADFVTRLLSLTDRMDVELHTDVPTDAWTALSVPQRLQSSGDLGMRLDTAIGAALDSGRPRVTILGSDAPTLPLEHLTALWALLADVALGPAEDGGYYAITCRNWVPGALAGVPWSQADTRECTVAACRRAGLSTALGPGWFDVDEPADLDRLLAEPVLPPALAAWREQACASGLTPGRS